MAELAQIVMEQSRKIDELINEVHRLTLLVLKDKVDTTWVDEDTAASMLGISARTLRRSVKGAERNWRMITYRSTNGRNYQYSRKTILTFKEKTSTY